MTSFVVVLLRTKPKWNHDDYGYTIAYRQSIFDYLQPDPWEKYVGHRYVIQISHDFVCLCDWKIPLAIHGLGEADCRDSNRAI
jgi:hypothetical protein